MAIGLGAAGAAAKAARLLARRSAGAGTAGPLGRRSGRRTMIRRAAEAVRRWRWGTALVGAERAAARQHDDLACLARQIVAEMELQIERQFGQRRPRCPEIAHGDAGAATGPADIQR